MKMAAIYYNVNDKLHDMKKQLQMTPIRHISLIKNPLDICMTKVKVLYSYNREISCYRCKQER